MKRLFLLVLALVLMSVMCHAAIHYVNPNGSGQYTTILAAYTAAGTGDTLLVSPGNYTDELLIQRKTAIIGAGWDQVTTSRIVLDVFATSSLLEGLRVEYCCDEAIFAESATDSLVVRRCFVRTTGVHPCFNRHLASLGKWLTFDGCVLQSGGVNGAIVLWSVKDSLIVRNCILAQSSATVSNQAVLVGDPRFVTMVNNTMVNVKEIFNTTGTYWLYAANNIVWDWNPGPTWGTYSPTAVFEYNASQNAVPPPGTNGLSFASDQFISYNEANGYEHGVSNLHIFNGSILQNAGLPSVNDRDGSRSDLGCYGGPYQLVDNGVPAFPFILFFTSSPVIMNGDSAGVTTVGRVGPRY